MLLGVMALIGCGEGGGPAVAEQPGMPALFVEVAARVGEAGAPAGWTARARWTAPEPARTLAPGECRRAGTARGAPEGPVRGDRVAGEMLILGPTPATLAWEAASGAWTAVGPRQSLDPAWSVSDLAWTDDDGEHRAEDAVRFGGVPAITRVMREREGQVILGWDPGTVEEPTVLVSGPGGLLECGVDRTGVTLPWWAVPAQGGEVVLRSSREESNLVDGVLLRVRTTIERRIPLDRPVWTTAEEERPDFEAYSPHGPRRLQRRPRQPVG